MRLVTPFDEIRHFDGTIETGILYVETRHGFPLRGNGCYFDSVAKDAFELDLIQHSDIKYQVKASLKLDRRHFYSLFKICLKRSRVQNKQSLHLLDF